MSSLVFNGSTDWVNVAGLSDQLNAAHTVAMWVKRARVATSDPFFHMATAGDKFWFNFLSDNTIRVYHAGFTPTSVGTSTLHTDITGWHSYACTYDGSTIKLFCDGRVIKIQTGVTGSLGLAAGDGLRFGGKSGQAFMGQIDQALLYSRALTDAEIAGIYNSGTIPSANLIGDYEFDEGSGTTAIDTSTSANNGVITSATYSADVPTPVPASNANMMAFVS